MRGAGRNATTSAMQAAANAFFMRFTIAAGGSRPGALAKFPGVGRTVGGQPKSQRWQKTWRPPPLSIFDRGRAGPRRYRRGTVNRFWIGREDLETTPATLLGSIESGIRVRQQGIGISIVRGRRANPDADGKRHLKSIHWNWNRKRFHDLCGNRRCCLRIGQIEKEDNKLVPSQPGDRIFLAHGQQEALD